MMATGPGCRREVQNISVFVRVRPLSQKEVDSNSKNIVTCVDNKIKIKDKTYKFDRVFDPKSTQLDVYKHVVEPLIDDVMNGYNCTVFAYGQTGSGKTYTMNGGDINSSDNWKIDPNAGFIPRAAFNIFDKINCAVSADCTVRVSYMELYNEELRDLLNPDDLGPPLTLYSDPQNKGSVCIIGLKEITVLNKNDIYQLISMGTKKKRMVSTGLNANSSRSHTLFTISVHSREIGASAEDIVKLGKLNLVDLAGSESMNKAGTYNRIVEVANINKSLLTLGRVINILADKKNQYVPYRDSKLTRILQDSLGGKTKTSIITTISPHSSNFDESVNTLDYANRARNIINCPQVNEKTTKNKVIQTLKGEIDKCKRSLLAIQKQKGIFLNQEEYHNLTENMKDYPNHLVTKKQFIRFLHESIDSLELLIEERSKQYDETNAASSRQQQALDNCKKEQKQKEKLLKKERFVSQALKNTENELSKTNKLLFTDSENYVTNQELYIKKIRTYQGISSKQKEIAQKTFSTLGSVTKEIDECNVSCAECLAKRQDKSRENANKIVTELEKVEKKVVQEIPEFLNAEKATVASLNLHNDVSSTVLPVKLAIQEITKNCHDQLLTYKGSANIENVDILSIQDEIQQNVEMFDHSGPQKIRDFIKNDNNKNKKMIKELENLERQTLSFITESEYNLNLYLTEYRRVHERTLKKLERIRKSKKNLESRISSTSQKTQLENYMSEISGTNDFVEVFSTFNSPCPQYSKLEDSIKENLSTGKQMSSEMERMCETASRLETKVKEENDNSKLMVNMCEELQNEGKLLRQKFNEKYENHHNHIQNVMSEHQSYSEHLVENIHEQVYEEGLKRINAIEPEGDTPIKQTSNFRKILQNLVNKPNFRTLDE